MNYKKIATILKISGMLICSLGITVLAEENEVILDYAKGIQDGVYGWTLSEDGSYYMLSAVNEDGTPKESSAASGSRHGGKGMKGDKPEGRPDGKKEGKPDFSKGKKDGNELPPEGADPLAMEENHKASKQHVNAQGVYTEANITNTEYQTMLVYVPAEYMEIGEDGTAVFTDQQIGDYTAATAPIIFQNSNSGWRSGSPSAPEYAEALEAGMIYVSCGSRSRDAVGSDGSITGKAPVPVADLKAGVIALRANSDVIPGDKDRIISVGASGGGQMSSALGATGNMTEYYPYLYESGALGVTYDAETDTYYSEYDDSVYGAMAYCPIADIDNADLAYAWMRYDSTLNEDGSYSETVGSYEFSEFELALQEDAAEAFGQYINSLALVDENGELLTFDEETDGSINLRSGSYYNATLQNITDAMLAAGTVMEDGSSEITDIADFIIATGLVRNKDIPGFDAFNLSAENNAFGSSDTEAVHFSASMAQVMLDHYDEYKEMDGFDSEQVDAYIDNALKGNGAEAIAQQAYLVNATHIMLNVANGTQDADIAKHWRTRNGTADQHTSFSVAYNICLAAEMAGADADYALVWQMGHGSNEGTTTGTLVDWINSIV